jgi:3-oxoacyl-[acyl-carrier-protein] synthase II
MNGTANGRRRVVVTGIGLLTPCGATAERTWTALAAGRSGIGPITLFDAAGFESRIAGEVRDFAVEDYVERRDARRMDRFEHLAVAAAEQAMRHSGLRVTPSNADRIATIVGSAIGGLGSLEAAHRTLLERGPGRVSPFLILQMSANLAPGYITMRFGLKGPSWSTASACSTGAHAIGEALRGIQRGEFDAALAGAAEAPVTPLAMAGFCSMKALSRANDRPEAASRPFDAGRDGFVMAEGAAILVLEAAEHAEARGARVLAELVGYGATSDAHHATSPAPRHAGGQEAMRRSLADAGLRPADVGYLNAHATSTELGDRLEAEGIGDVFGEAAAQLAVSSTKSMTGHMNGAAGAAEAAITVLALEHGLLPPTINVERQDPDVALDVIPNIARPRQVDYALSNSFGFGGTNAALVFGRPGARR